MPCSREEEILKKIKEEKKTIEDLRKRVEEVKKDIEKIEILQKEAKACTKMNA